MPGNILAPVVALVAWTLLMLVWLILVRTPALRKAGIDIGKVSGSAPGQLDGVIADKAQWPAHNYMHLVEQPTLFYAISIVLFLEHAGTGLNATLAWAYVGLRVLHSLIQITFNRIIVRFFVFLLSTLVLMAMTFHAAMPFLHGM